MNENWFKNFKNYYFLTLIWVETRNYTFNNFPSYIFVYNNFEMYKGEMSAKTFKNHVFNLNYWIDIQSFLIQKCI